MALTYFFLALTFAHRARCAALIRAKPAAEIFRLVMDCAFADPLR